MKATELSCRGTPRIPSDRSRRTAVVVISVTWQQTAVERCFVGYKIPAAGTLKLALNNCSMA